MDHPLKHTIWSLTKDLSLIEKAKRGVKLADPDLYWSAVLRNVEALVKPRKRPKPRAELSGEAKARYRQAKWEYESVKFKPWVQDGHFIEPDFSMSGANDLTTWICNYLKWTGHFANRTSNEGRVIIKDGEPKRIPSSSKNGMQDIDANLKHPEHPYGIPWKIEVKWGKDTHKEHQKDFGKIVQQTGGVYSVVIDVDDFFSQLDRLLVRKRLFS